jgi:hypothetical protein
MIDGRAVKKLGNGLIHLNQKKQERLKMSHMLSAFIMKYDSVLSN